MPSISASILNCRQTCIGEGVLQALDSGAESIHVDIMDGDYVQNLSFGPQLIDDLREITKAPIIVHLELGRPERFLPMFARTAADGIYFQVDTCTNPIWLINSIKKSGKKAGAGIGPAYGVESVRYILKNLDGLNVMSVEPGYGGQAFEDSVYEKLRQARALMDEIGHAIPVSVDGGVNTSNAGRLIAAGADILICGSSIFGGGDIRGNVRRLRHEF